MLGSAHPTSSLFCGCLLIRELSRLGRIEILSTPVITSARRWLNRGIWQTTMINQIVVIGYLLGVSPIELRQWYQDRSKLSFRYLWLALLSRCK